MVSLTKKKRYNIDVVEGLMENFHELEATLTEGNPSHMYPIYDYSIAVKNVKLTNMERLILEERFPMDDVCPSTADVATSLGVSEQYIGKTTKTIARKIMTEMNRGIPNV